MEALLVVEPQILSGHGDVGGSRLILPAHKGGVVMGAGVANAVPGVGVGEIVGGFPGVKGEFQHLHARQAGVLQQLADLRGQIAQVLGDELDVGEFLGQDPDKVHAGAFYPAADLGGGLPVGHRPVALQTAEVVDAENVVQPGGTGDAANPPGVAVGFHGVPVVEGIAPQLAVGGEVVRRHARHLGGDVPLVQLESPGVRPHVGGVHGHVDGQVADDADALFMGVGPQVLPLAEEQVLDVGEQADVIRQLLLVTRYCLRAAEADVLIRPLRPGLHAEMALDSHEQGVVRQPGSIFL